MDSIWISVFHMDPLTVNWFMDSRQISWSTSDTWIHGSLRSKWTPCLYVDLRWIFASYVDTWTIHWFVDPTRVSGGSLHPICIHEPSMELWMHGESVDPYRIHGSMDQFASMDPQFVDPSWIHGFYLDAWIKSRSMGSWWIPKLDFNPLLL